MFRTRPIVKPTDIPRRMLEQNLDVWVCSYGGSGTNMLADYLASKSRVIHTPIWRNLICHHARPINVHRPTKAIYLFGDPVVAFESMKRRTSFPEVNLCKLTNRQESKYTDRKLFRAMLRQFRNWTQPNSTNLEILVVKFEDLFSSGKHAIASFLEINVDDFPRLRPRETASSNAMGLPTECRRYARQIDTIRSFPSSLVLAPGPHFRERSVA